MGCDAELVQCTSTAAGVFTRRCYKTSSPKRAILSTMGPLSINFYLHAIQQLQDLLVFQAVHPQFPQVVALAVQQLLALSETFLQDTNTLHRGCKHTTQMVDTR